MSRLGIVIGIMALVAAGCGSGEDPAFGAASELPSCESGTRSVMTFLQRTLDDVGDGDDAELAAYEARFDYGVEGLLQRAQEMHCTEEGFNRAIIARVDELEPRGPAGRDLVDRVAVIGLGSSDPALGGPLTLTDD